MGAAVIALHELLHGQVFGVLVAKTEAAGELALVVEEQTLLGAAGEQVERVTDAREGFSGRSELRPLFVRELAPYDAWS